MTAKPELNAESERVMEMARHDLLMRMREASEDRYCAGWHIGLEYLLWDEPEWQAIGYALGGWWVWPERWVPLHEWLIMYGEHSDGQDTC